MKKLLYSLILILILQSCKNNNEELERLKFENEMLQKKLTEKKAIASKFVWTVINFKTGTIHGDDNGNETLENIKSEVVWSDIIEVQDFDKTIELKLQDDLENRLRKKRLGFIHSIQSRKTYTFDTYAEASEFKFKTTSN